jgi:hypothetical protein
MTIPEHYVMTLKHAGQICVKNSYTHCHDSLKNGLGIDTKQQVDRYDSHTSCSCHCTKNGYNGEDINELLKDNINRIKED